MAVANFFDKAALGAAQVLQGFDGAAFASELERAPIGVAFDEAAVQTSEGKVTLELVVNLLARLYPHLIVAPLATVPDDVVGELMASAYAINPDVHITDDLAEAALIVVVGDSPVMAERPVIYVGADGWIVRSSTLRPVGSGTSPNPFGAAAAACFAAANVFRQLFADQLPGRAIDTHVRMSLIDLQPSAPTPYNPDWRTVDLEEMFLVGVGAIGNAAVWTLARARHLRGTLHLIDNEVVETSNLQRYVLAGQEEVGKPKVEIAAATLAESSINAAPFSGRWGQFLHERADWELQRVAVAVDSEHDRMAIQAALPQWIVNAWTQPQDLGISRHTFVEQACLMCLYLTDELRKNEDELVAEAIGLPGDLMEVRQRLATGTPVDQPFLERVATALGIPIKPLLAFAGKPLRTFYSGAICGGLTLRLGAQQPTAHQVTVPMAFQSALAGVLLAAELVIHAGQLREAPLPTTTRIDLLRPLSAHLSIAAAKHSLGRCMCQDADYVGRFHAKYGDS